MENLTFENLFSEFANDFNNPLLTQSQQNRIRSLHEQNGKSNLKISLIQSDSWMMGANIIDDENCTVMDTGRTFFTFEKSALDLNEYETFLAKLCELKSLDLILIKDKMIRAGLPKIIQDSICNENDEAEESEVEVEVSCDEPNEDTNEDLQNDNEEKMVEIPDPIETEEEIESNDLENIDEAEDSEDFTDQEDEN